MLKSFKKGYIFMNDQENLTVVYDTKKLQAILNCGRRQAYELMNSNTFPSFSINTKHYVYKEDFENWLRHCKGRKIVI